MVREGEQRPQLSLRERARRLLIWSLMLAAIYVPGAVALAIILTGNLGDR